MLQANITLSEAQLKQFIIEGLAATGVTETAGPVFLSYDKGGGNCMDPGNGFTATISVVLAGQKATINKSQKELEELVKAAANARGYTVGNPGVGLNHYQGDGPRESNSITAHVFVELPEKV